MAGSDPLARGPFEQILAEARLSNSGLAFQEHYTRLSGRGRAPRGLQAFPLGLAPHQGRSGQGLGGRAHVGGGQQPLVGLAGLLARGGAQLALKR